MSIAATPPNKLPWSEDAMHRVYSYGRLVCDMCLFASRTLGTSDVVMTGDDERTLCRVCRSKLRRGAETPIDPRARQWWSAAWRDAAATRDNYGSSDTYLAALPVVRRYQALEEAARQAWMLEQEAANYEDGPDA